MLLLTLPKLLQALEVLMKLRTPRVAVDIRFALSAQRLELFMDIGEKLIRIPGPDRAESPFIGCPFMQLVGRYPVQELVYCTAEREG